MKPKTALLVVLATAVVLFGGLLVVILVGRTAQAIRAQISSETARQQFVAAWRPPGSPAPDVVFPGEVHGYRVATREATAGSRSPDIDLPGSRGVYERPGAPAIEVLVFRPTSLESEAILQRARTVFDRRGGSRTVLQINNRLRLGSSQPPETLEIWSMPKGWLFLFRTPGELDAEFVRAYLAAISGRPGA